MCPRIGQLVRLTRVGSGLVYGGDPSARPTNLVSETASVSSVANTANASPTDSSRDHTYHVLADANMGPGEPNTGTLMLQKIGYVVLLPRYQSTTTHREGTVS